MVKNPLHIHLLGVFRLTDGETPVTAVNSPRMQSLLVYLLLNRAAPQPRYHVSFLLWPDSPETQARSNLRNLLHRLRQAYPRIEAFLQENNGELCWRADAPFTLDVAEFDLALAQAKRAAESGDQNALRTALEQSVDYYSGDLLPSCYDEWILPHRERLRQAFLEALEQLSGLQEQQLHYRQAITSAQRLLRYDPLHETIYRRLMQLYALIGDRTGALRVYQTCAAVLKRELDVEPDAATRAVYQSILAAHAQPTAVARAKISGNLPARLTSFIGREDEVDAVKQLLKVNRLLTLTGPFGSGKTRVGLEVADHLALEGQFAGGVMWVELAQMDDPKLLPQTIATVVGVREKPGETVFQSLVEALRDRCMLLLLDNCEHMLPACSTFVSNLLKACPHLSILTTSREALNVKGEVIWQVSPLALPTAVECEDKSDRSDRFGDARPVRRVDPGQMLQYASIRLFVERAIAVLPTFQLTRRNAPSVALVCRRLEGLPLAIELAAARVRMMSVEQIAARLDDALPLLKANWGSELPHHQTLQAAIDWSYTLLSAQEQALLRRLSVFTGGFTLDAAEQVAPLENTTGVCIPGTLISRGDVLDLLSSLIDKSLVMVESETAGDVRYRLLEIVRQYARKRLDEAQELEPALSRHADFFLALVEEAGPRLRGANQAAWLCRLDQENDNLRVVLAWSQNQSTQPEFGLRLAAGLWQYWDVRGNFTEGRRWLEETLARAPERSTLRAGALKAAGALAWGQGDYRKAQALLSESLAIHQAFGNQRDIAAALLNLGILSYTLGDYPAARPLFEQSLQIFRQMSHQQGIANVLNSFGVWASDQGDYSSARSYLAESLTLRREMEDQRGVAVVLGNLGVAAWREGDYPAARPLLQECLEKYRELGDRRGAGTALIELGRVVQQMGEFDLTLRLFKESLEIWQALGNQEGIATFLEGSAGLAVRWCDYELAARLLSAAGALRERVASPLAPADRADLDRILDRVKAALSEDHLGVLWSQGRTLSLETALDMAVSMRRQPDCI